MNKRELDKLETILKDADNVIAIIEKDGEVHLSFSQQLSEMEVLDILALVTSKFVISINVFPSSYFLHGTLLLPDTVALTLRLPLR